MIKLKSNNRTEFVGSNLYYSQEFVDDLYRKINTLDNILSKTKENIVLKINGYKEYIKYCLLISNIKTQRFEILSLKHRIAELEAILEMLEGK